MNNLLYHGPGGTGKTFAIKKFMVEYKKRGYKIAATALTGIAAIGLNVPEEGIYATTIHSWSGVGVAKKPKKELYKKIIRFKKEAWTVDILVIDEISMMNLELFEKLEWLARKIRKDETPFGGIKLVLSGDFLQLPPVEGKWVFESPRWTGLNLEVIKMEEGKRFTDPDWFELLKRIRIGEHTDDDVKLLENRVVTKDTKINKDILPTLLFATNRRTRSYNTAELKKLKEELKTYTSMDKQSTNKNCTANQLTYLDSIIPRELNFKIGAQVMLRINLNLEEELVNGARGVVIDLEEHQIRVRFRTGEWWIPRHSWNSEYYGIKIVRVQFPLILAWSQTIHKSQGATLDTVICSLDKTVFADAQAYIALSRVRTIEDLHLLRFTPSAIKTNAAALKYYKSI